MGEWQKVALARVFYRDARVVVLDEPTSALDPLAEAELFRNFRRLIDGRSAVLVSHRFSSVKTADRQLPAQPPDGRRTPQSAQGAGGARHRRDLRSKELLADKVRYCLIRSLIPTVEDWKRTRLPDSLYFLYYLLRPLRLAGVSLRRSPGPGRC